jgi:predicted anti-sigma-YlaC factor YlaD
MKCDAYRILISDLADGTLDAEEVALVCEHLRTCENCQAFEAGQRTRAGNPGGTSSCHDANQDAPARAVAARGFSWGWAAAAIVGTMIFVVVFFALGGGRWSLGVRGEHGDGHPRPAAWSHR